MLSLILFIKKESFRREFELSSDSIVQIDGEPYNDLSCPDGVLLSIYSISQFKKLEKHNRQFVANVSHELKTPLTAIIGYIETLIDSENLDDKMINRFLNVIKKNSLRLSQIVNDLLTLSSLEKDEASTEGVSLIEGKIKTVVEEAISICEYKANAKNVEIEYLAEKDFSCLMNAGLLEQAIVNLIDNAIKYSPENSSVKVSVIDSNKNIVIRIVDNGPGIPSKYHARIFERFFSVDKARSRTMGGSGLGCLSLSTLLSIIMDRYLLKTTYLMVQLLLF